MANIYDPQWDEPRTAPGFEVKRARLGYQTGMQRLGLSLWELPPGQAAYPYHLHLAEEEALVVLDGRPQLRTPDGWRVLEPGDVVSFPRGEDGAHQLVNRDAEASVRFLSISTNGEPDVVIYPDADKVSAAERRPDGSGLKLYFRRGDAVDYWEGEEPPAPS
jgi:uncharacterized cupin superfamily protein